MVMGLCRATLAWIGAAVMLSSCSDGVAAHDAARQSPTSTVHIGLAHIAQPHPAVAISKSEGCPRTLRGIRGVRNSLPMLAHQLVPSSPYPVGGLVCGYNQPPPTSLRGAPITLNYRQARQLAAALGRLPLGVITEPISCPADLGTTVLIALDYGPQGMVTLEYRNTGCQTVDNGQVQAGQQIDNPPFDRFQAAIRRVAPRLFT